jgi:hypothetical protein
VFERIAQQFAVNPVVTLPHKHNFEMQKSIPIAEDVLWQQQLQLIINMQKMLLSGTWVRVLPQHFKDYRQSHG